MKFALALGLSLWTWVAHAQANAPFSQWCQNRLRILERHQEQALREVQRQAPMQAAFTLMNGLDEALQRLEPYYQGSLTIKAMRRGRDNANVILQDLGERQLWAKSMVNYLFAQYDFVRRVAQQLDIPFYRPAPCHYCQKENLELERHFVRFALEQVRLPIEKLVWREGAMIYPLGEAKTFLKALELTSAQSATDLEQSLFATRHACLIDDLWTLHKALATDWGRSEPVAVQEFYHSAARLVGNSCGSSRERRDGQTLAGHGERLNSWPDSFPQVLNEGKILRFQVDSSRPLAKLVITAEGWGSEAEVDVLVNGDLKGNLFLPRRDPVYYISTDGEYAETILLIGRRGTARIQSIHPIYR